MSLDAVLRLNRAQEFALGTARRELRDMFTALALAVECNDLDIPTDTIPVEDRLHALVVASGTKLLMDETPEDTFRAAWMTGYKRELQCTQEQAEEAYTFPDIDWTKVRAPQAWIADVGFCCGIYDGIRSRTYFAMCATEDAKKDQGAGV